MSTGWDAGLIARRALDLAIAVEREMRERLTWKPTGFSAQLAERVESIWRDQKEVFVDEDAIRDQVRRVKDAWRAWARANQTHDPHAGHESAFFAGAVAGASEAEVSKEGRLNQAGMVVDEVFIWMRRRGRNPVILSDVENPMEGVTDLHVKLRNHLADSCVVLQPVREK